jgi:hypothetical protein
MINPFRVGDRVIRKGMPTVVTITGIGDHRPVDGAVRRGVVCYLSDGSWEFYWHLLRAA